MLRVRPNVIYERMELENIFITSRIFFLRRVLLVAAKRSYLSSLSVVLNEGKAGEKKRKSVKKRKKKR